MDAKLQLKIAMLGRLQDFLRAYPLGDEPGDKVIARFMERMDRLRALIAQQQDGAVSRTAENARRRELEQRMTRLPLRNLAGIAGALDKQHGEVAAALTQQVHNLSVQRFLTTARSIATTAQDHHDVLRANGMAEGTLEDLNAQIDEYEQALHDANAGRRAHTGAQAEVRELGRELMTMARQLEGMVRYRFHDKTEVLGAWKSARNVAWPVVQPVKAQVPAGTGAVVSQGAQPSQ